jgi:hypothetical protein
MFIACLGLELKKAICSFVQLYIMCGKKMRGGGVFFENASYCGYTITKVIMQNCIEGIRTVLEPLNFLAILVGPQTNDAGLNR